MTTVYKLLRKIEGGGKMPSINEISKMLTDFGIKHVINNTFNLVEYRSMHNVYVNSRHKGKEGKELIIRDAGISIDSSESYYSANTWQYAAQIINYLKEKGKIN